MAKSTTRYVCQSCGASFPRWTGKCESCNAWNSIVEEAGRVEMPKGLSRGKGKTIERPDGSFILTSPGLVATLTNTSTEASVTWSITGSFHQSTLPNGDTFTKMTGRNLVTDPVAGFALISGDFSFTAAPDGSIVVPLNGKGRIVDVCDALS